MRCHAVGLLSLFLGSMGVTSLAAAESPEFDEFRAPPSGPDCRLSVTASMQERARGRRNFTAAVVISSPWGGCAKTSELQSLRDDSERAPHSRKRNEGENQSLEERAAGEARSRTEPATLRTVKAPTSNEAVAQAPETALLAHAKLRSPSVASGLGGDRVPPSPHHVATSPDQRSRLSKSLDESGMQLADQSAKDAERAERGERLYLVSPQLAREVVRRALDGSGHERALSRLDAAESRARWSAALPELRLRGLRGIDESARVDYAGDDPPETTLRGDADYTLEARLTWRWSETVFSGEEPGLERLRAQWAKDARRVSEQALAILFEWQRAQAVLTDVWASPEAHRTALLDAAEAEVILSVMTDGWFSADRLRRAPWMISRANSHEAPENAVPAGDPGRSDEIQGAPMKGPETPVSVPLSKPAPPE